MKKLSVIGIVLAALSYATFCGAAEYTIVVNGGNPVTQLTKSEAKNIFLGRKTTWANGRTIEVVVLDGGPAHKAFCADVINKTPSQFSTFWKTALFTGTGTLPKSVVSDAEMVRFVKSNPLAIGYISSGTAPDGVKTVTIE